VRAGTIRLGQFLKLANLLDSGAEAKQVIAEGGVHVDGEVELRRGRQLGGGEVVSVAGGGTARVRTGGDPGPTPGHPPQR